MFQYPRRPQIQRASCMYIMFNCERVRGHRNVPLPRGTERVMMNYLGTLRLLRCSQPLRNRGFNGELSKEHKCAQMIPGLPELRVL
jgi:hypothetical protein